MALTKKHCELMISHGPPDGFTHWRCMCGAKSFDGETWFEDDKTALIKQVRALFPVAGNG